MVSEFTRKNYLSSCAEAGMFYSPATSTARTALGRKTTESEKAQNRCQARLLVNKHLGRNGGGRDNNGDSQYLSPFDSSTSPNGNNYDGQNGSGPQRSKSVSPSPNHGGSGISGRRVPIDMVDSRGFPIDPLTQKDSSSGMEAYFRRRNITPVVNSNPQLDFGDFESQSTPTRPIFTVRNVPLRNLDELRETIAIRRNYFKERLLGIKTNNGETPVGSQNGVNGDASQPEGAAPEPGTSKSTSSRNSPEKRAQPGEIHASNAFDEETPVITGTGPDLTQTIIPGNPKFDDVLVPEN